MSVCVSGREGLFSTNKEQQILFSQGITFFCLSYEIKTIVIGSILPDVGNNKRPDNEQIYNQ